MYAGEGDKGVLLICPGLHRVRIILEFIGFGYKKKKNTSLKITERFDTTVTSLETGQRWQTRAAVK